LFIRFIVPRARQNNANY